MGNCCRKKSDIGPLTVLILGLADSGKTEIAHTLCKQPRTDYSSTKGVHMFAIDANDHTVKLTEIGGSDSVRGIWPHYYTDAFGVIFVIDCSLNAPFEQTRDILHQIMHNKHIRGKPLLIVANKQDLDESIDVIDITYFFRVDELCNMLGTPCLIVPCGRFDHTDLNNGVGWLVDNVVENYKTLKNRMRFNVLSSPIKRFRRQRTSLPHKRTDNDKRKRIRSAPSTLASRSQPKPNGVISTIKIHDRLQHLQSSRQTMFKMSQSIVIQHV